MEATRKASEAREHRYLASGCARVLRVMDLLERAEADGAWRPAYKALSVPAKGMMMQHEVALDPYSRLRAASRTRAEHTVSRLQAGIQAIQGRPELVTARMIEHETGLTFKTIQRNAAAYELYKATAEVFRNGPKRRPNRRRHSRATASGLPVSDALLAYNKPQFAARLRTALKRAEELETALAVQAANCQEQHIRSMLTLRVDVARLEKHNG